MMEEEKNQRLRFARKFPRVVRVIEPQGCLSRECVQMCKCSKILSFATLIKLNSASKMSH